MQVKEKYLKKNILILTVGLDILFIIIFFIFYLSGLKYGLNLTSLFTAITEQLSLILIIIHPFLMWLVIRENTKITRDQIAEFEISLQEQYSKFDQVYEFVEKLRLGESKYSFSSEFQEDKLVRSIMNLSAELDKTRKEEEIRKKEEQQRHWTNEGLALFGKILRENVEDLEKLASEVTSNLTKYLNSQQAGFFYIKEEEGEKVIEMLALFAFQRKKFPDKKFKWGEGLIGACAIEQKTIFLKKTTDSFVDITSGLGNANPRSILIVPIKDNDQNIHGVLEIASFKVYEDFEVNFVEQVAESIGLTMASIKSTIRTQELLRESQKQTEMLAQQETNMRQNIEEIEFERIKAEEVSLKLTSFSNSVEKFILHADISLDGKIININTKLQESLLYTDKNYIEGQDFISLIPVNERSIFEKIWQEIIDQQETKEIELKLLTSNNNFKWFNSKFFPVLDQNEKITHVTFLSTEETEQQNNLIEQKLAKISIDQVASNLQIETDGKIIYANENFINLIGYTKNEITQLFFSDLLPDDEKGRFGLTFNSIKKGNKNRAVRQFVCKDKSTLYFDTLIQPITDLNGELSKIYVAAVNLTELYSNVRKANDYKTQLDKTNSELKNLKKSTEEQIEKSKISIKKEYSEFEEKSLIFEKLFEKQQKAIILIQDDLIIYFNTLAANLLGLKKELSIGKRTKYIFPREEEMIKTENYIGNFLDKEQQNSNLCLFDKEGHKKEIIVDIDFITFENKNLTSIVMQEKK